MADPADYYREIYLRGLGGEKPSIPVAIAELERRAAEEMEESAAAYVFAGAGDRGHDATPTAPPSRGAGWCRGCSATSPSATSRRRCSGPRCRRRCCWRRSASRRSSTRTASWRPRAPPAALGVPMIASTASHFTLEEIADACGRGPRWFQLYWSNERRDRRELRQAAPRRPATERSSSPSTPSSPAGSRATCSRPGCPFLQGMGVANFFQDPVFRAGLEKTPEEDVGAATGHFLGVYVNPSLTWDDLGWLRELTSLPILVKGIQHVDDAREAVAPRRRRDRRLQPRRPPGRRRDRLPRCPGPIAEAVGDELTVLFDSGIRSGSDVIKALALGADARPPRPSLHLGPGPRGPAGRRNRPQDDPRRPRPDDGPLRLHRAWADRRPRRSPERRESSAPQGDPTSARSSRASRRSCSTSSRSTTGSEQGLRRILSHLFSCIRRASAWDTLDHIPSILLLAVFAALVTVTIRLIDPAPRASPGRRSGRRPGTVSMLLILFRIIEPAHTSGSATVGCCFGPLRRGDGRTPIFVALAAAAGIALGGGLAVREERNS